ncbi:efflux protein, mate family [Halogeometricum borinquense DSM 11551]|uniref:Multidrug-efflux transporter n=2 Tax=Halogeometricum borinquense TaxID=60847 RepID=E4NQS5_HALBP|nr:putative efflux protein, MATE family [Halogeometricum borinquense DSM 11551]ELY24208.1 efflux protein, mate family [Halogeometricum borinquense DSM 11551]RYJ13223.1 MATE family efflux transporter [Halogeometricum borinquense]
MYRIEIGVLHVVSRVPNPIRRCIVSIGLVLAHFGIIDRDRATRTAELAWPRIVTGLARMSKNAVDVALVGSASGVAAITGVGFAGPYWGLAFALGGGVAAGTLALVSQRYGADQSDGIGVAIRSSTLLVVLSTLPVTVIFWLFPVQLISVLTDNPNVIDLGARYLRLVGLGVPFAGLNLVGSRALVGADDAYTAMLLRSGGAVTNIILSATLIFGLDMSVEGAAVGTVLSNVVVTGAFALGLTRGELPGVGEFPIRIDPFGRYVDREIIDDIVSIGLPVFGRSLVWTVAEFPMLAIVNLFGKNVAAAFVITRRIWGLMNTPGWGFGLASSSLVGQALGKDDEDTAEAYGREIVRFSVATYIVSAVLVAIFAEPIVRQFVKNPGPDVVPTAVGLVYAACLAVIMQGVSGASAGPLDASGDTSIPFYSQLLGMFGCSIPITYLGAQTGHIEALYLALLAETTVPAAINYYRFTTGKWKSVSQQYRPGSPADD